jgi:hypothetical protein
MISFTLYNGSYNLPPFSCIKYSYRNAVIVFIAIIARFVCVVNIVSAVFFILFAALSTFYLDILRFSSIIIIVWNVLGG